MNLRYALKKVPVFKSRHVSKWIARVTEHVKLSPQCFSILLCLSSIKKTVSSVGKRNAGSGPFLVVYSGCQNGDTENIGILCIGVFFPQLPDLL